MIGMLPPSLISFPTSFPSAYFNQPHWSFTSYHEPSYSHLDIVILSAWHFLTHHIWELLVPLNHSGLYQDITSNCPYLINSYFFSHCLLQSSTLAFQFISWAKLSSPWHCNSLCLSHSQTPIYGIADFLKSFRYLLRYHFKLAFPDN